MKNLIALAALVLAGCAFLPATALADYGGQMPAKHAKHHAKHHKHRA
jgi:hypothetical protein